METDFSLGMSYSNATIDEGYVKTLVNFDYSEDKKYLTPRAGLRTSEFVFPDLAETVLDNAEFLSSDVCIKDMKDCIENGVAYVQCIYGVPDEEDSSTGRIWVATFKKKNDQNLETQFVVDGEPFEIALSDSLVYTTSMPCVFYSTELQEIHGLRLQEDARTGFPVGCFAFGNSYYFFALIEETVDNETVTTKKLYRTVWGTDRYKFEEVDLKTITASEAVLYGYNMLSETPYTFKNTLTGSKITLEGILPYESTDSDAKLVMTPRKNQRLNYRCYYNAPANGNYQFIWEWRISESDSWTKIDEETFTVAENRPSSVSFVAPTADIMIRVRAYNTAAEDYGQEDATVEHAMVVGFDFTIDEHGTTTNLEQKNYDLSENTGMTVWRNRLILWGLKEDPTILFVSDMNEPAYFPYPNNITVFDDPIIAVLDFMDKLIVFTTNKCYQVELSADANSWTTTVIQANLHVTRWDKHLIQAVRNMIYFKSGNYYFMLVPKAKSTTGDLTLAPISNPMTEFFNHFMKNIEQLFIDTYGIVGDTIPTYELITYYNFLDYEDVHNMYIFRWSEADTLLHVDIMYNTVNRSWKINVIEEANLLYVYRHDATQRGIYATTTTMLVDNVTSQAPRRVVQLFQYDPVNLRDFYVPKELILYKAADDTFDGVAVDGNSVVFPSGSAEITDVDLAIGNIVVDELSVTPSNPVCLLGSHNYYGGFKIPELAKGIQMVIDNYEDYFRYRNYQFLDTGYRTDRLHYNKRYRELQIHVNNMDSKDLSFGTEFYIDGSIRESIYKYNVTQAINEMDGEYATAYIEPQVFMDIPVDTIDLSNTWTIKHDLNPEINLWKLRIQVSGKGTAPRLKLSSRRETRYQLLSFNWIYRIMNMR